MPAAIGPRFVLEAGFLILLAVVVGLADLSPALIVVVMTVGWLLVALIEYFAWRQTAAFATVQRYASVEAPPPTAHDEVEDMAPPPPPPPPPAAPAPTEEETIVAPPPAEPPPAEAEEEPETFKPERLILHRLEPLQPRPRKRWIIIGPRERPAAAPEGDREEER